MTVKNLLTKLLQNYFKPRFSYEMFSSLTTVITDGCIAAMFCCKFKNWFYFEYNSQSECLYFCHQVVWIHSSILDSLKRKTRPKYNKLVCVVKLVPVMPD